MFLNRLKGQGAVKPIGTQPLNGLSWSIEILKRDKHALGLLFFCGREVVFNSVQLSLCTSFKLAYVL